MTPEIPGVFRFEPDIAEAATLPATWYRDPAILDRERERVFARTWQLAGRSEQARRLLKDYGFCLLLRRRTLASTLL